jgi:hypothetical protein
LFWEIGYISSKDGEDSTDQRVRADHLNTISTGSNEGFEEQGHAVVEKPVTSKGARVRSKAIKFSSR